MTDLAQVNGNLPEQHYPMLPIERMGHIAAILPEQLSGRSGVNRITEYNPQIDAHDDHEAVQMWLAEYSDSPETFRAYRREAERLLLWCWRSHGKALSDLNRQDFFRYQEFVKDPQPASVWCGPRKARTDDDWKPFAGPLTEKGQKQALTILKGLFGYLRDADYLRGNPVSLIKQKAAKKDRSKKVERYLEQADIDLLFTLKPANLDTRRQKDEYMRNKTLLFFLYYLAPRCSEVAECRMNDFFDRRGKWWWKVQGKGRKYAEVPVREEMLHQLIEYRRHLKLSDLPSIDDDSAFIRSVSGTGSVSNNMIYRLSKKILTDAAEAVRSTDPVQAARLEKASTHWFRHTAITHLADQGVDLRLVSKTARHSKLETTAIYFHAEEDAWHDAVNGTKQ